MKEVSRNESTKKGKKQSQKGEGKLLKPPPTPKNG